MECKKMSEKIIPAVIAVIAAMLLGSTVMASAQTGTYRQAPHAYTQRIAPNGTATGADPYAGTMWEGVVPYGSDQAANPYAGTIWDGVVPY
jgi:hypothetical protein